MNKYLSRAIDWIKLADHGHMTVATLSLLAIYIIPYFGFSYSKIDRRPEILPIAIIYTTLPAIFLWASIKFLHSGRDEPKNMMQNIKINHSEDSDQSNALENKLITLESSATSRATEMWLKAKRFELLGQIAAFFSIAMPFSTWFYTLSHVAEKQKFDHLWPFIFSSTSFGFVSITVGVTLLRHSKTYLQEMSIAKSQSEGFQRIRLAMHVDSSGLNMDALEVMTKYAGPPRAKTEDEAPPQNSDEMKNSFALITSMLSKT